MTPGDRWKLFIPAELAYGDFGSGDDIPQGATLTFDVELIEILEADPVVDELGGPWVVGIGCLIIAVIAYCARAGRSGGARTAQARHILLPNRELCDKYKLLMDAVTADKGADAGMAKFREIEAKVMGEAGGDLGEFSPGQLVAAIDKITWDAPIGVVQGPVESRQGWHLVLVTARSAEAGGANEVGANKVKEQ